MFCYYPQPGNKQETLAQWFFYIEPPSTPTLTLSVRGPSLDVRVRQILTSKDGPRSERSEHLYLP